MILAAGTIHSAKLLMLSGVGDATELKKLGIAPVANLRGVGNNLQDHVLVSGVVYQYKGKMPDRPADSNAVEAEVYLSSGLDDHPTDIALVLEQLPDRNARSGGPVRGAPQRGFHDRAGAGSADEPRTGTACERRTGAIRPSSRRTI